MAAVVAVLIPARYLVSTEGASAGWLEQAFAAKLSSGFLPLSVRFGGAAGAGLLAALVLVVVSTAFTVRDLRRSMR